MTEVHLLFLHAALQIFVKFNQFLQQGDPIIPVLEDQINVQHLFCKFVPVATVKNATSISSMPYTLENQLPGFEFEFEFELQ